MGKRSTLSVVLLGLGLTFGSARASAQDPPAVSAPDRNASKSGSTQRTVGWVTVGVGSAVTLAGGYYWIRAYSETNNPSDEFNAYASASARKPDGTREVPSGTDVCDAARANQDNQMVIDECDRNASHRRLGLVLVPTGLVIAGVGTYLVLSADKGTETARRTPRPRVLPSLALGPRGGQVWMNVAF
jgi:hypothetical protein